MDQQQEDNIDNANNVAAKSRAPVEVMRRYIESLPEEITFKEEITSYQFWKAVRTEFLATLLFIVFGCGPCLSYASLPPKMSFWSSNTSSIDKSLNSNLNIESSELIVLEIKVSLVFGLTSATLIQCMGQVSGCHLTPAISLSLLVTRRLTILRCFMYIFAQCFASIVACGILYGLLTSEERLHSGLGLTIPKDHLNASQAFGYEFLATFIVVLAYLVNSDPQRTDAGFKSLSIGFAYSIAHFFSVRKLISFHFIVIASIYYRSYEYSFIISNFIIQIEILFFILLFLIFSNFFFA